MLRLCLLPLALSPLLFSAPSAAQDAAAEKNARALLTGLVVTALAEEPALDVVASEDVRTQVELEAGRQLAGCADGGTSCLAELAGALGARLVVYGTIGQLGESVVLNLNLFDSSASSAVGRAAVREPSVDAVANGVAPAVRAMVARFLAEQPVPAGERVKVLVLDLEGNLAAPPPPPPAPGVSIPGVVALGVGGVCALGAAGLLAVSGLAHNEATDPKTLQKDVPALYDRRDLTGWIGSGVFVVAVVGLGAGAALLALGGE